MALPQTDLARIKKWCDSIWPEHMWDQAKVEPDVAPRHVTIIEVRPDWRGGPEQTRFPIARLRYTALTGRWAIYWRDRNLKFHEYQFKAPSQNVQSLLDYIRDSKDPIFFGYGRDQRHRGARCPPIVGALGAANQCRSRHLRWISGRAE